MKKEKTQLPHVFEPGDICCNQRKKIVVITGIKDNYYQYILTETESFETVIHGTVFSQKGTIDSQHVSVFDKYNYIFQPFMK